MTTVKPGQEVNLLLPSASLSVEGFTGVLKALRFMDTSAIKMHRKGSA